MRFLKTSRLIAYLFIISFLYINGSCGGDEPAPTVTLPATTPPISTTTGVVSPTLGAGAIIKVVQTETGLDALNESQTIEPQFNNAGQLVKANYTSTSSRSTNATATVSYVYDANGFLTTRKTTIDYGGVIPQRIATETFEYQNGRLNKVVKSQNIDENYKEVPVFSTSKLFSYDAQGNLTAYKRIDKNGVETEGYDCSFDGSGKITAYKRHSTDPTELDVDYTFADGRVSRRVVKSKNVVRYINDYVYDVDGQSTRYTTTMNGTTTFWTYTYDTMKSPVDFTSFFLSDAEGGGQFDNLLFKGHPKYPVWFMYGKNKNNVLTVTDSNPLGRQLTYAYKYDAKGYPTEVTYSVYNGTQKASTQGKRLYTYFN